MLFRDCGRTLVNPYFEVGEMNFAVYVRNSCFPDENNLIVATFTFQAYTRYPLKSVIKLQDTSVHIFLYCKRWRFGFNQFSSRGVLELVSTIHAANFVPLITDYVLGGGGGGGLHLKPPWTHICSCHNFFPLSFVQILLIPACCLLCVL